MVAASRAGPLLQPWIHGHVPGGLVPGLSQPSTTHRAEPTRAAVSVLCAVDHLYATETRRRFRRQDRRTTTADAPQARLTSRAETEDLVTASRNRCRPTAVSND